MSKHQLGKFLRRKWKFSSGWIINRMNGEPEALLMVPHSSFYTEGQHECGDGDRFLQKDHRTPGRSRETRSWRGNARLVSSADISLDEARSTVSAPEDLMAEKVAEAKERRVRRGQVEDWLCARNHRGSIARYTIGRASPGRMRVDLYRYGITGNQPRPGLRKVTFVLAHG